MAIGDASLVLRVFDIIGTIFLWTWWALLIGGIWLLKKKYERHPIDCVIIEKRGDNLIKTNERAGKVENKITGVVSYQLSKSKETMPVINFEWMLHNADKHMNIFERIVTFLRPTIGTVFLFKYGSRQYKPINVKNNPQTENFLNLKALRKRDGSLIYQWMYEQFDPRWVLGVLDFEVVDWDNMNFMVQEQRASVMRRTKGMDWMKTIMVPAMMIAGAVIASIFILKFSAESGAQLSGGGGQAIDASERPDTGIIGGAIDNVVSPPGT